MNRLAILCLLCASILAACCVAQISVTTAHPNDPKLDDLIAQVKDTPASRLDKNLPAVNFSDWLLAQAGPDAKIVWAYRPPHLGLDWGNPHFCSDCVQADATLYNGRHFSILIANSTDSGPTFYSGTIMIPREEIDDIRQLSDLPRPLWKARKNSTCTEAKR